MQKTVIRLSVNCKTVVTQLKGTFLVFFVLSSVTHIKVEKSNRNYFNFVEDVSYITAVVRVRNFYSILILEQL